MRPKPVLLYGLYFLSALVFFALVLFPEKEAAKGITNFVNQALGGVRLETDTAGTAFPAGLDLSGSRWTLFHFPPVKPETMRLNLSLPSLFNPLKDLTFKAKINQGQVRGNLRQVSFSGKEFASLDMDLSNIQVRNFPYQTDQYNMTLSFDAGGRYEYLKPQNSSRASLILLNFTADLPGNPEAEKLGLSKLEFSRVELEFTMENKRIILTKCSARGPLMSLDMEGEVSTAEPLDIRLKGQLNPGPSFVSKLSTLASVRDLFRDTPGKGIPISISGTLRHPEIGFR
ncbi:MAG: type II secretion system protein GspN [Desulfobacula sp.]|nr:type II secretion system protein GspN [Desulfobacula sp.]